MFLTFRIRPIRQYRLTCIHNCSNPREFQILNSRNEGAASGRGIKHEDFDDAGVVGDLRGVEKKDFYAMSWECEYYEIDPL